MNSKHFNLKVSNIEPPKGGRGRDREGEGGGRGEGGGGGIESE